MRNVFAGLTALALLISSGVPVFAATMTVKGQVVDEGCGLKDAAAKKAMKSDCELECAKSGEPLALVTPDGKVYRIGGGLAANKNAKLIAHMGHTVEITGAVSQIDGKVVIAADALKMAR